MAAIADRAAQAPCRSRNLSGIAPAMNDPLQQKITAIVARAPDWMRQDLLSKDVVIRQRAEES